MPFATLVSSVGVEPTTLTGYGPKPYAYANSATRTLYIQILRHGNAKIKLL